MSELFVPTSPFLWTLEFNLPNLRMITFGLGRFRISHQILEQRCHSFLLRTFNMEDPWLLQNNCWIFLVCIGEKWKCRCKLQRLEKKVAKRTKDPQLLPQVVWRELKIGAKIVDLLQQHAKPKLTATNDIKPRFLSFSLFIFIGVVDQTRVTPRKH